MPGPDHRRNGWRHPGCRPLHHGGPSFFRHPARFKEAPTIASLSQFRNSELDGSRTGVPATVPPVAVALVEPAGIRAPDLARVRVSTSSAISLYAVKPIISRKKSRSMVIVGSSVRVQSW